MRRDRSPSEDRGKAPNPVWDNPGSQLPGTGLGAGFESGLYGTSRRRDHSIPERTRLRTSQSEGVSTGSTADGSAALPSPGVDRPSCLPTLVEMTLSRILSRRRHGTRLPTGIGLASVTICGDLLTQGLPLSLSLWKRPLRNIEPTCRWKKLRLQNILQFV